MKKILLFAFALFTLSFSAQTYTWQWGKMGGGDNGFSGETSSSYFPDFTRHEMILDMAVDANNNYYYLTPIYGGNSNIDGSAVNTYTDDRNILLFSTDCNGNLRWKRVIGGSSDNEKAYRIQLDNNGGLLLFFYTINIATVNNTYLPPRFGENNILAKRTADSNEYQDGYKTAFLLKYDTQDGNLTWRKDLQGLVNSGNMWSDVGSSHMDSQGILHAILGFPQGTHLDGLVTVPSSFSNSYQYFMVKFNGDGVIQGTPQVLPITGFTNSLNGETHLLYDETLNRYYFAGSRRNSDNSYTPLSYNGSAFTRDAFVLAFNGATLAEEWRKEFSTTSTFQQSLIFSLIKDSQSNVYLSGRFFRAANSSIAFDTTQFNTPLISHISYVIKLNSNGNVLWTKIPDGLSDGSTDVVASITDGLAINGNEIVYAKGSIREIWGSYQMVRPANDRPDPLLVRLNKETGAVIDAADVKSNFGIQDQFTSIAVDNDGNYVLGGFFHDQLFTDPNDSVSTLTYIGTYRSQFFYTKYAKSACSAMATVETPVKETDLVFYPNPVQDILHVKTKKQLKSFEIITTDGRQIKSGEFKGNAYQISVQELTAGVYYVKVSGNNFTTVGKMIKK